MGVKERREREKVELRDKIIEAARALFANEGFEAVSMRRIAEQIEYSPAAIYVYFPDKESLFREICRHDFDSLLCNFKQIAAVDDPVVRIYLIGYGYISFGITHPSHYRMMFMREVPHIPPEDQDLAKMDDPNQDGYAFTRAAVTDAIDSGALREELRDPELVTQTIWAVVHGVTAIEITFHNDPWLELCPLEQRRLTALDSTMRGLLRDPSDFARIKKAAMDILATAGGAK